MAGKSLLPADEISEKRLVLHQSRNLMLFRFVLLGLLWYFVERFKFRILDWLAGIFGMSPSTVTDIKSFLSTIIVIFFVALVLKVYVQWRSMSYVITPGKLVINSGIIAKKTSVFDSEQFNGLTVRQSILGKMLGYGSITAEHEYGVKGAGDMSLQGIGSPHSRLPQIEQLLLKK